MKWLKNGQGNVKILCNYSCSISFLVKILLVKLKVTSATKVFFAIK